VRPDEDRSDSLSPAARARVEVAVVVPVFEGAATLAGVVAEVRAAFRDRALQIVLVDDGSTDGSAEVCARLASEDPETITCVRLSRNFGEHSAVLAGLRYARGEVALVLDDDGQNPPAEGRRLVDELLRTGLDVVYGRYRVKRHSPWRNLGSRFHDAVANRLLGKPRGLYLSSFKAMNRFVVDQLVRAKSGRPYLDGLILRVTRRLGQLEVEHRGGPPSSYTFGKLAGLWLDMIVGSSLAPLRAAAVLGFATAGATLPLMVATVVDKLFVNPDVTVGVPTVLLTIVFFAGVQLVILGTLGEYLGRLFLDQGGAPQSVVRSVEGLGAEEPPAAGGAREPTAVPR
jgi:undecaprenyl-phosphate 4-deoxy-4-formamido-L-arabinose transferase